MITKREVVREIGKTLKGAKKATGNTLMEYQISLLDYLILYTFCLGAGGALELYYSPINYGEPM